MFSVSFVMIIRVTARVLSMSLLTATVSFLFLVQTICWTTARTDVPWSSMLFLLTFFLKVRSGSLINFTLSAVTCHQKFVCFNFFTEHCRQNDTWSQEHYGKRSTKRQVNSTSMTSSESLWRGAAIFAFLACFYFSWKIQVFIMSDVNC